MINLNFKVEITILWEGAMFLRLQSEIKKTCIYSKTYNNEKQLSNL